MSMSVYVHIPFCLRKCYYCDFVSYAGADDLHQPYVAALCREIAGRGGIFAAEGQRVNSVFIGGGTPTFLSGAQLNEILLCLNNNLPLTPDAEVSLEANPGTVDESKLAVLRQAGVNRLSLGVQSFDDLLLKNIGRIHNAEDAWQAVNMARQAGFTNINIDLMHGLPGQTLSTWQESLSVAVSLGADHISAYSLIVEEDTPLSAQLADGRIHLPEEDVDAAMFAFTHDYLVARGYEHYEISNYAKPGKRCRHNLSYWRYRPYAGFGAAACSFNGRVRTTNTANIGAYIKAIADQLSPVAETEELNRQTMMAEYIFLALRTADGLSWTEFSNRFSIDFCAYYGNILTNLKDKGFIEETTDGIRLTRLGMLFGNQVFAEFLPD